MKKIIIPLLLAVSFSFSCNNSANEKNKEKGNDNNAVVIEGNISGASGKTLYLEKLTPAKVRKLDSTILKSGGEFEFSDKAKISNIYRLRIGKDALFLVSKPGENIEVTSENMPLVTNTSLKGSDDSKASLEMQEHMMKTSKELQKLSQDYQQQKQKADVDMKKLNNEINQKAQKLFQDEKAFLSKKIKNNKQSLFIYLALYQRFGQSNIFTYKNDKEMFENVLSYMEEHNPESPFTKSLKSDINKTKMQNDKKSSGKGNLGKGDIAPDIQMENPDGEMKSLHELRGQYVLLDFWAGWCRPCRLENPNIVSTYKKYKSENFTIFQVSLDKKRKTWLNAIEKDNLHGWTHVSDLKYWNSKAAAKYGVKSIPANYLLNPKGEIIAKDLRGPALGKKLEEIFNN